MGSFRIDPLDIDPFVILPDFTLDRVQAYWFVSIMRSVYLRDPARGAQLHSLAGGGPGHLIEHFQPRFPKAEIWDYGPGRALVGFEGTTEWQQLILQATRSGLIVHPEFLGRVSAFWISAATLLLPQIVSLLEELDVRQVVIYGHSMGGAVAMLYANLLAQRDYHVLGVYTAGSPRVGDGTYAHDERHRRHCRLTQHGDPVPLLPPSLNRPLDTTLLDLWPMPPTSYRHWGQRFHLLTDGSVFIPDEQSTWTEAGLVLAGVVAGDRSWYAGHQTDEYARRLRIGINPAGGVAAFTVDPIDVIDSWWSDLLGIDVAAVWPIIPACS